MTSYIHLIGRTGTMAFGKMTVEVTIRQVKVAFGVLRYLVRPVAGHGDAWVNADRVEIEY